MLELLALFFIFAKIGFFTIGGGMAMLPLIQQELISRQLMTTQQAIDMVAISQMTPGPFAVNCATFTGMRLDSLPGAFFATLGVSLPSFIICIIVSKWFFRFNQNPIVRSLLSGIKPVVFALILAGLFSIGAPALLPDFNSLTSFSPALLLTVDLPVFFIALISAPILVKTKFSPALLILASALFGALFLR